MGFFGGKFPVQGFFFFCGGGGCGGCGGEGGRV